MFFSLIRRLKSNKFIGAKQNGHAWARVIWQEEEESKSNLITRQRLSGEYKFLSTTSEQSRTSVSLFNSDGPMASVFITEGRETRCRDVLVRVCFVYNSMRRDTQFFHSAWKLELSFHNSWKNINTARLSQTWELQNYKKSQTEF